MPKRKTRGADAMPAVSATHILLDITSEVTLHEVKELEKGEFLTFLRNRQLGEKEAITYKDVRIRVAGIEPGPVGRVTESTHVELLARPTVIPSDIIFAVNRSYSMRAKDLKPHRFDASVSAIKHYLRKRLEFDFIDRVGIITFGHDWEEASELRQVSEYFIEAAIDELKKAKIGGRSSISSAIAGATDIFMLEGDKKRLRALVILTDQATDPFGDPLEEARKAAKSGIIIYPVLIGVQEDDSAHHASVLAAVSSETGGKMYRAPSFEKLELVCLDMANHLRLQIHGGKGGRSSGSRSDHWETKNAAPSPGSRPRGEKDGNKHKEAVITVRGWNEQPQNEHAAAKDAPGESTSIKTLKKIKSALWD